MLSRIRVLDLTDGGAALCGQILGDLGADVVLVEPPCGAASRGESPFWRDLPGPVAWSAPREAAASEAALQARGVPAHRVATSADCFSDPQLAARGHFVWLDHPQLGAVVLESSRLRFSRTLHSAAWPGPLLGQHNFAVLSGLLGMSDDEIAQLAAGGALE